MAQFDWNLTIASTQDGTYYLLGASTGTAERWIWPSSSKILNFTARATAFSPSLWVLLLVKPV
jgi:hypothetical protein